MQQEEYAGYSFEVDETFEWSLRHKLLGIKNALSSLKEECMAESQVTSSNGAKELLETTSKVLEALEHSYERDFQDEGIEYSNKSDEPWD